MMRGIAQHIFLTILLLISGFMANAQNHNNLITTGKDLVLLIDVTSSPKDIDTILKRAGITEIDAEKVIKGDYSAIYKDGWVLSAKKKNIVEFDRSLLELKKNAPNTPYIITAETNNRDQHAGYMDNALYGINNFPSVSVIELPSGLTRFILPGFLSAKRAFLSGGFNEWSTLKGKMTKTATGWQIDIKLETGAWMYKFIVDSRWMEDPNTPIKKDDGAGNINSIYYKCNHIFKLKGHLSAQKVVLAGSFNNWRNDELYLDKATDGWELPVYLHEGTHLYGFYVDDKWTPDPTNKQHYEKDNRENSVLDIGETVNFKLNGFENAHNVFVAGSFNQWQNGKIALQKVQGGWALPVILPAGNYDYRFIVDGRWIIDPGNQSLVPEGGEINSFIAVKPNHVFKLKGYGNAHRIVLSGSFNDWNEAGPTLTHTGDEWTISMRLKPGKQLYKFIIDGNWIIDPDNKLFENNQFGTFNSVLWIGP